MPFDPITKWERLTPETVRMLNQHGKLVIQGTIDLGFGAGQVSDHEKCVWTIAGHRISITYNFETLVFAQSKEIDPLYTERKGHVTTTHQGL